jgi:glutamate-1-semialdehyde 2,1-aminomutase
MKQLAPEGPVYQAGTLSGNPLAMAAGLATLKCLAEPGVYEVLEERSRALTEGLVAIAADCGVEFTTVALGGLFGFFFRADPVRDFGEATLAHGGRFRAFFREMLARGVYLAPSPYESGFVSLAHRPREIAETLDAARLALRSASRVR